MIFRSMIVIKYRKGIVSVFRNEILAYSEKQYSVEIFIYLV